MFYIIKEEIRMRNNKGFTLVELIVVLVILAILAAILVPSMISWIDEANKRSVITTARSVYVGIQAALSEAYGNQTLTRLDIETTTSNSDLNTDWQPPIDPGDNIFTQIVKKGMILAGYENNPDIEAHLIQIGTGAEGEPVGAGEVMRLDVVVKGVTASYAPGPGGTMAWSVDGDFEGTTDIPDEYVDPNL